MILCMPPHGASASLCWYARRAAGVACGSCIHAFVTPGLGRGAFSASDHQGHRYIIQRSTSSTMIYHPYAHKHTLHRINACLVDINLYASESCLKQNDNEGKEVWRHALHFLWSGSTRSERNTVVGIFYLVIKDEPAGCFSLFRDQQFIYVCYLQTIAGCLVRIWQGVGHLVYPFHIKSIMHHY